MEKSSESRKGSIPLVCGYCGSRHVKIIRDATHVLIRCEDCGRRLFAYYADSDRWVEGDQPPEDADPFLVRRVESDLLAQVGEPARVLYEFLRRYTQAHGYAPTIREMREGVGWESTNMVDYCLKQLEAVELIERDYATSRGIRLVRVA